MGGLSDGTGKRREASSPVGGTLFEAGAAVFCPALLHAPLEAWVREFRHNKATHGHATLVSITDNAIAVVKEELEKDIP